MSNAAFRAAIERLLRRAMASGWYGLVDLLADELSRRPKPRTVATEAAARNAGRNHATLGIRPSAPDVVEAP